MINGIIGKKVGMTQLFSDENKVIPVTVVDISNLIVSQVKSKDNEGYDSIQVAMLRDKYKNKKFSLDFLNRKLSPFNKYKKSKKKSKSTQA